MPHWPSLGEFQAVLFDVDGTLVDSLGMIIPGLADSIEKYAGTRPPDHEIRELVGMPMRAQIERYLDHSPSNEELTEITDYTIERFDAYKHRESHFVPAIEFLRLCKNNGLKTALVTSKNAKELALFMKRFHGADAVDATVCASDVQHPKPAPDSALRAAELLGVAPERAVLIGDSIYDMRCAKSAGVVSVAVGYGSATTEVLMAENLDLFFQTPDDLLAWAHQTFQNPNGPQESTTRRLDSHDDRRSAGAA